MLFTAKKLPFIKTTAVFKYLLLLCIAFLLLYLAFRGISIRLIFNEILKASFFPVFLSFLFSFIALISRSIRWNLFLEPLGYRPPLRKTFYALMMGYFANLAFPRLGEVTRCGSLSRSEKIPFNVLLGTVIAERIIDVLSLQACILLAAIIEADRLGNFLRASIIDPILNKAGSLLASTTGWILTITALILLAITIVWWIRKNRRQEKDSRITVLVKGMIAGLQSVRKMKRPWLFIFHSVFIWLLYYLSVYVALFALPFSSHLDAGAALFLLVAGGVGMSAPVQGGIGAYHLLVSQGLILYGLTQEQGLTFATLLHSLQILLIVIFGCYALLMLFLDNRQPAERV